MHKATILGFVLLACLLSGCNLGHRIYKYDTTAPPADRWEEKEKKCIEYKNYVDKKHAARNKYEKNSFVSNICTGDNEYRFSFGIIEFDDHGAHWDREQLHRVKKEINEISNAQLNGQINSEGILLVVFVHGWRHNASEGSSHLLRFRELARTIAGSDEICNNARSNANENNGLQRNSSQCESRPYVLAVYLSWRGDSLGLTNTYTQDPTLRALQLLTFWDRKGAAR